PVSVGEDGHDARRGQIVGGDGHVEVDGVGPEGTVDHVATLLGHPRPVRVRVTRHGAGHEKAVLVEFGPVALVEGPDAAHGSGQFGVRDVDARVGDRDGYALAFVAQLPHVIYERGAVAVPNGCV